MSGSGDTRTMPLVPVAAAPKGKARARRRGRATDRRVSVAHHPLVAARVRAAKGWGALGGFAIVALASVGAGAPTFDVLLRALVGGVVGWLVTWTAAVQIGRAVVRAEVEAHVRALEEEAEKDEEEDEASDLF